MATVTKPIALDESINTTEVTPRNVADVLAQELANIASAIGGGGGSGGHTIENSSGTALPQRTNLQFGSGLGVTDDAVNDATVVELTSESVHANMYVKLWENPNPSASFVAQDITLASDDYDFTFWVYAPYSGRIDSKTIPKGASALLDQTTGYRGNENIRIRGINYVSDTKYSIEDGKLGQATETTANNICIPLVIYGFKKSLDITAIVSNVSTDATRCIMSDGVTNVEDAVEEKARKTDIATVESGSTASRAYSVGELVYVNGQLYKVITAISLGSAFTVGTNIQSTSVSDALESSNILGSSVVIPFGADYTCSADGYLQIYIFNSKEMNVKIKGADSGTAITYNVKNVTGTGNTYSLYVRKGMIIRCNNTSSEGSLNFTPFT